jgi:hypothetical protein
VPDDADAVAADDADAVGAADADAEADPAVAPDAEPGAEGDPDAEPDALALVEGDGAPGEDEPWPAGWPPVHAAAASNGSSAAAAASRGRKVIGVTPSVCPLVRRTQGIRRAAVPAFPTARGVRLLR